MEQNGIGLVLAGGGGKGAYHIGIWKALVEYGYMDAVSGVSGTSVGALNALLYANGDYAVGERVWTHISQKDILRFDPKTVMKLMPLVFGGGAIFLSAGIWSAVAKALKHGVFSPQGIEDLILSNIDFSRIASLQMPVFAGAYALADKHQKGGMRYLRMDGEQADTVKRIAMASSALPVVFPRQVVNNVTYLDGGVADNVPLKPLYDLGFRKFIVCYLDDDCKPDRFKKEYPDAQIFELIPSEDQGGVVSGLLDFSAEGAVRRIGQGYDDTVRLLPSIRELLQ